MSTCGTRRQRWRAPAGRLALAAALLLVPPAAAAEEKPEDYPAGPHREDTFYFCSACHGFKIVAQQGMSRERWDESLSWMTERHKMPKLEGKDRERMLDYLAAAFPERREPRGWRNPFSPQQ
jgi:hypothetical protein